MAKEDALLRDIARLFVKYGTDEWKPVIALLRTGGPAHTEIAIAIEELLPRALRPPPRSTEKRPSRAKPEARGRRSSEPPIPPDIDPLRAEALELLYGALRARNALSSAAALRDAYVRSGGKEALPAKRDEAVRALVRHMAGLSQPAFETALQQIGEQRSDLRGEYTRWFDLIYKRGGGDPS